MRTENSKAITSVEKVHLRAVKSLPCSVCDTPAPGERA